MNIACIAWGSLLWKPEPLRLRSPWCAGGPELPLEFVRDSDDSDELAIVICEGAATMPTFYAALEADNLEEARAMLGQREKICTSRPEWIGSIPPREGCPADARIGAWLHAHPFDAVVWTALPPKFGKVDGRIPSAQEAVGYLANLTGPAREHARQYIERTPPAIATAYRRLVERELGWLPVPARQSA